MINIPYRVRQGLLRAGIVVLVLVLIVASVGLCWFLWLQRYVIYTKDRGVVIDMSLSEQVPEGQIAEISPPETVPVHYTDGEEEEATGNQLRQMLGFYADAETLKMKNFGIKSVHGLLK